MQRWKMNSTQHLQKGFSLIEVTAAVLIIGLLAGGAAIGIKNQIDKARVTSTKGNLATIEQAIDLFDMECGSYPETLSELVDGPSSGCSGFPKGGFLKKSAVPLDAWEQDFNYLREGVHNAAGFDLWSNGEDKEEGTEDDIVNWEKAE